MIGERLRKLRKDRKISQEELGSILGVKKSAVSLYETENNEPSDEIKVQIAEYFKVSIDYLLGLTDEAIPLDKNLYFRFPENATEEEIALISEFLNFIVCRRKFKNKLI